MSKGSKGTKTLIRDFGIIADVVGEQMGCFLFQLPPSYRYTKARLSAILTQLDPAYRNPVEFRRKSWWSEVYRAFSAAGIIFCSCAALAFLMNSSGRRMRFTPASMVLSEVRPQQFG